MSLNSSAREKQDSNDDGSVPESRIQVVSSYEAQIGDEDSDDLLRRQLAKQETQLHQLAQSLSEAQAQAAAKREILNWIVNSRSWKITAWLRTLNFWKDGFKSSFQLRSHDQFIGALDEPLENSSLSSTVTVSGWTYSTDEPIVRVEVFIGSIPIGTLKYGIQRPDVAVYPSEAPLRCGFYGQLVVDESFTDAQVLTVRVTDKRGQRIEFRRAVEIAHSVNRHPLADRNVIPDASKLDGGSRGNGLSAAKELVSNTGRIALESFLVSGSKLRFPRVQSPQISIILVLFNRAELTLHCLYSILNSNYKSYEVVIVDNASTDETGRLLALIEGARIIRNEANVHYLRACNQASRQAQGEGLLLLNNDTQLLPNSLELALRTLKSSDDIGAVGGRIVLPDGTLQEAGCIIWQDGSCLGYGRGESPFAPAYMFKRDVDYCSAAFLLTPRSLFLEDSGFDEAYVPAYYEETDYCVRLWKKNKRIVYDPDVTLLHYEFASSGSSRDAIALQTKNRKIFVTRHQDWLNSQPFASPENPLKARSHQRRDAKKILYLDDRIPHLTLGSGFPRSNRIVNEMVNMGHSVTCYPIEFSDEHWQDVYRDIPREVEVMAGHSLTQLERFLFERADYFDLIFVSRPHNMRALRHLLETRSEFRVGAKIIYDAEAIFSLREIEKLRLSGDHLSLNEKQELVEAEMELARPADRIISVSEKEAEEFRRFGFGDVHTLGHGLNPVPTSNGFDDRSGFLFVGAVHTVDSPNADSLRWFARDIFPLIQKRFKTEVKLVVAGTVHPEISEQLVSKDIEFRGEVRDLTSLYNTARIFIAPTRFAAGIPHKIHEASAHGLPVVATSLLGAQLGWEHRNELLVEENAEGFAEACINLYQDPEMWNNLRSSALKRVSIDCSPDIFAQQLRIILQ